MKTYIGIPTFGYDWTLQPIGGITIIHYLSNNAAINLAIEKEAVIQYDETTVHTASSFVSEAYFQAIHHF